MEAELELDIKGLKLDVIDRLEPYGISVKELYFFENDIRGLAKLPLKQRKKKFDELIDRIRTYYNK